MKLPATVATWIQAIRGPRSVSLTGGLIACVLVIERTVVSGTIYDLNSPPIWPLIASGLAASVGFSLVLFVAHLTVLRKRSEQLMPLWLVLLVYACASLAGGTLQGLAAGPLGVGEGASIGRVVLAILLFSIIAVTLTARDERQAASQRLLQERQQLVALGEWATNETVRLRNSLADLAIEKIVPAITQIAIQLRQASSAASFHQIAHEVRDCAHTVVRELSHSLATGHDTTLDTRLTPTKVVATQGVSSSGGLFRLALNVKPIHPVLFTITLLLMAVPSSNAAANPLLMLLLIVLIGLFLSFGAWILRRIASVGARLAVVLLCYGLAAVAPSVWISSLSDLSGVDQFLSWLFCFAAFLLIGALWALIAAYFAARDLAMRDLAIAVAAIRWQTSQLEAREHALRQEISGILHSQVQSRLAALAMKLDIAADSLDSSADPASVTAQALDTLNATAEDIRALATGNPTPRFASLDAALEQVVSTWQALVTISITVSPAARSLLEPLGAAIQTLSDLANDVATNSARHGKATQLEISIELTGSDLAVSARDNGLGVSSNPQAGLGLGRLESLGGSWELSSIAAGSQLIVTLPLGELSASTPAPAPR